MIVFFGISNGKTIHHHRAAESRKPESPASACVSPASSKHLLRKRAGKTPGLPGVWLRFLVQFLAYSHSEKQSAPLHTTVPVPHRCQLPSRRSPCLQEHFLDF